MGYLKRWASALIALAGLNGALPHAHAQNNKTKSHGTDSLDITSVTLDADTDPSSDGRWMP